MLGSLLGPDNIRIINSTLNITGIGANPTVYTVTRTDDYDDRSSSRYEGTLRYALESTTKNRLIKFQLPPNQKIFLKKPLNMTVGDFIADGTQGAIGLEISGFPLIIGNSSNNSNNIPKNFVFKNLRFYRGDYAILNKPPFNDRKDYRNNLDTLTINGASQFAFINCEFAWCADGLADLFNVSQGMFLACTLTHPLANPELHIENGEKIRHDLGYSIRGGNEFYVVNCFIGPIKERGSNNDPIRVGFPKTASYQLGNITSYFKAGTKINAPLTSPVSSIMTIQDCLFVHINDPTLNISATDAKPLIIEKQKKGIKINLFNNQLYRNNQKVSMPVHYDDPKNSKYVENAKQTFSFTYLTSEELYNLIRTEGMVIGAQPPNKYSLMIRDDILGFKGKPLLSQDDLRLNRELDRELEPDFTTTTTVTYLPSASVVKAEPQKQKEKEGNTEKAFATDDSSIAEHKSKKQKFRKA